MPTTLTFAAPLNISCQVGDTAYYVPTTSSGGFSTNSSAVIEIGIITAIGGTNTAPTITVALNLSTPPSPSFILFSKDNKANLSSALGYFAKVEYKNTSTTEAELFSVGVDIFGSSK
jgi:hypothetical protein